MITKNLPITLLCSILLVDTCLPASVLNVQPVQSIIKTSLEKNDKEVIDNRNGKMLGLDTGNPEADSEAEMWIMALIGAMAAAAPLAFLNPGLGFKKKRSTDEDNSIADQIKRISTFINNKQ